MMKSLSLLVAALLCSGVPLQAQRVNGGGLVVDLTYGMSLPNGGWEFGEAQSRLGVGIEAPVAEGATVWGVASRMELNNVVGCALRCYAEGDPYMLQVGVGYRLNPIARVTPFVGVGGGLTLWSERGHQWSPGVRGGFDVKLARAIAIRLAAESDWEAPGRVTSGIAWQLP